LERLIRSFARRSRPRASGPLNLYVAGRWQKIEALEALLSGAPSWLWNGGRRVEAP